MQKCLMMGSGRSQCRRILKAPSSAPENETEWTTLDCNRNVKPDICFNLNRIESSIPLWNRLPVKSNSFDEVHMYEVLEHYGRPGDYKGFFRGFRELWRILKPEGILIGTSPAWNNRWAWGDPGHTRVIQQEQFAWLDKENYTKFLGGTAMTDYSHCVSPRWWKVVHQEIKFGNFSFALKAVKG